MSVELNINNLTSQDFIRDASASDIARLVSNLASQASQKAVRYEAGVKNALDLIDYWKGRDSNKMTAEQVLEMVESSLRNALK